MSGKVSDNQGRSSGLVKSGATTYDDNKVQANVALLGFKTAVNGSLAKYNLVDQIVDEYTDATGVDASASTNELLASGVYAGGTNVTPTITHDADATAVDGDYTVYKWTATGAGSYVNDTTQDHEYLSVGGGGGGAYNFGGGGGAGGYLAATGLSLTGGNTYTPTVGGGGNGGILGVRKGVTGSSSSLSGTGISTITSSGGGGGGYGGSGSNDARSGASGGGGGGDSSAGNGGSSTVGQGNDGGDGDGSSGNAGGGGGGASAVGADASGTNAGNGGAGTNNDIVETGTDVGYAGGGGGAVGSGGTSGTASHGGGAGGNNTGAGTGGTANTGGGGGGGASGASGGAGGAGIMVLRRLTTITSVNNLTLQSNDTTASTANPDYADMVVLMENAEGAATLNTDIKGFISEDSGVTFTEGTLVDEGTWGTNKKIIAFHDLDISAQSGSAMCYKITTHNQSEGSKETKIHATSIGWK